MRRLFLFSTIFLFLSSFLAAQQIEGRIIDSEGNSVEYVNVGLSGSRTGVISDGKGNFSIFVPDSLSGREIVFSHITYDPLSVSASELIRRAAEGERVEIVLTPRIVEMSDVVVTPRKARYKRVGASHLSALPSNCYITERPRIHAIDPQELPENYRESLRDCEFNGEIISILNIRQPMQLLEISFPVNKMPHDSLLVRLNLYVREGEEFVPIHQRAIYSMVPHTTEKLYYQVDIPEDQIVVEPGMLYVGLEIVRYYGYKADKYLALPMHLGRGYYKSGIDFYEKIKIPVHAGIQVYGMLLSE